MTPAPDKSEVPPAGSVLFVGNSVNQLGGTGLSWAGLLKELRIFAGLAGTHDDHSKKPFAFHFEEMLASYRRKRFADKRLATKRQPITRKIIKAVDAKFTAKVARLTKQMKPNKYHASLMQLPVQNILTPNYDLCLEKACLTAGEKWEPAKTMADWGTKEVRYALFLRRKVEMAVKKGSPKQTKYVFHLHGDEERHKQIILGHEGYVESIARIRQYAALKVDDQHYKKTQRKTASKGEDFRIPNRGIYYENPGFLKAWFRHTDDLNNRGNTEAHSWVDLFMLRDVHIVGFGMDNSEADIWYLISSKSRLKYETAVPQALKDSTIYFHYFASPDTETAQKIALLKSFGVKCVPHPITITKDNKLDYRSAWNELLLDLRQRLSSRPTSSKRIKSARTSASKQR